jgi:hypothetical protein
MNYLINQQQTTFYFTFSLIVLKSLFWFKHINKCLKNGIGKQKS